MTDKTQQRLNVAMYNDNLWNFGLWMGVIYIKKLPVMVIR